MGRSQFGSTLLVTQSENCIHVCTLRAGGHKARSPAMVSLSSCCQARDDPARRVHGSKLKQNNFFMRQAVRCHFVMLQNKHLHTRF